MKKYISIAITFLSIWISPFLVSAQPPDIEIDLSFDKTQYQLGEPIGVTVEATNFGGSDILISDGFSEIVFYLKLRIIDPAGRLIGVIQDPSAGSGHPRGPVPVTFRDGEFVRVVPWETLVAGWSITSFTANLLEYYPLNLPGPYSAKVQVSAMEFKSGDPGNFENYQWQGVLESNVVYFNFAGATEVQAAPDRWSLDWLVDGSNKDIKIKIQPDEGLTVDDYELASIRLNNLEALEVRRQPTKIEAWFDAVEAFGTLGDVQAGEFHQVIVSGRLANGAFFGGAQEVEIIP